MLILEPQVQQHGPLNVMMVTQGWVYTKRPSPFAVVAA